MLSDRCHRPSRVPLVHLGWGYQREANPGSPVHGLGSSNSQEQEPSPPPLGGRGKGAEWLSGVIFPICDVAVARRLGLHPEKDGEEQHYEEEEDGATYSQGHDHLWARDGEGERKGISVFIGQISDCLPHTRCSSNGDIHKLVTDALKKSKAKRKGWKGRPVGKESLRKGQLTRDLESLRHLNLREEGLGARAEHVGRQEASIKDPNVGINLANSRISYEIRITIAE